MDALVVGLAPKKGASKKTKENVYICVRQALAAQRLQEPPHCGGEYQSRVNDVLSM
jgi:hypothetical protein